MSTHEMLVAAAVVELEEQVGGASAHELDGMAAVQIPARAAAALLSWIRDMEGVDERRALVLAGDVWAVDGVAAANFIATGDES